MPGHPDISISNIITNTGSLGMGISKAKGMIFANRLLGKKSKIFVITGDGELQEGQIWEAAMYAAHHKMDRVIATIDYNGQQIDGSTEQVLSLGNLTAKWEAFGWEVLHTNGNNMQELTDCLALAKSKTGAGKPIVIIMKTEMGAGVDFMMGSHKWHGVAPNDEQLAAALAQLTETLKDY